MHPPMSTAGVKPAHIKRKIGQLAGHQVAKDRKLSRSVCSSWCTTRMRKFSLRTRECRWAGRETCFWRHFWLNFKRLVISILLEKLSNTIQSPTITLSLLVSIRSERNTLSEKLISILKHHFWSKLEWHANSKPWLRLLYSPYLKLWGKKKSKKWRKNLQMRY